MFCLTHINVIAIMLWIMLYDTESRHVPVSAQRRRAQTRPRLLVLRPPAGSGQPNRVVVLTNPRFSQQDADKIRSDPTLRRIAARTSIPGQPEVSPSAPLKDSDIHPNSRARRLEANRASGSRSVRNMLAGIRNQPRASRAQSSNIARRSESVPRAMGPMVPRRNRFGELNMPRRIEMALRRMQQSRQRGGVHSDAQGTPTQQIRTQSSKQQSSSNVPRETLDLSGMSSNAVASSSVKSSPAVKSTHGTRTNMDNNGLRRSSAPRVNSRRANTVRNGRGGPSRFVHSNGMMNTIKPGNTGSNRRSMDTRNTFLRNGIQPAGSISRTTSSPPHNSPLKISAKLNATAKVQASVNSTNTNTTRTKSVKTKTIKVTTVVKGGTAADVAAAAAGQAQLANAVAQGKDINSSSLTKLVSKAIPKKPSPPVGSITIRREPNGVSVITLSDGLGEPVILRATGPVKIDRIIKPDGRVQFLINPVKPTVNPLDGEAEMEDITTTISPVMFLDLGNRINNRLIPTTIAPPLVKTTIAKTVPTTPELLNPSAKLPVTTVPVSSNSNLNLPLSSTQSAVLKTLPILTTAVNAVKKKKTLSNGEHSGTTVSNIANSNIVTKRAIASKVLGTGRNGADVGRKRSSLIDIIKTSLKRNNMTSNFSAGKNGLSPFGGPGLDRANANNVKNGLKSSRLTNNSSVDFSSFFQKPKIPRPPRFSDLFGNHTSLRDNVRHIGTRSKLPQKTPITAFTTTVSPVSVSAPSHVTTASSDVSTTISAPSSTSLSKQTETVTSSTDAMPQYEHIKSTAGLEIVPRKEGTTVPS